MSHKRPVKVVFCWHMHQPYYRDVQGKYELPWTYLHGIKDYVDMAAHLEAVAGAKAVVNFTPTLLEQIDDYGKQINACMSSGEAISDPLLAALVGPGLPEDPAVRDQLMSDCLRANENRLINPYPAFKRLVETIRWTRHHSDTAYLNDQFLADLLMWYHLAWLGASVRRGDSRVMGLLEKESGYTLQDRRLLVEIIGELLSNIIHRYKGLHEQGKVELSVTPYGHPIVPLMLDFKSAGQAQPDVHLPESDKYPGGLERVCWHIEKGIECFERYFGFRPQGCWPAEGAVSTETLKLLEKAGFIWAATGETVLANSLRADPNGSQPENDNHWLHQPYCLDGGKMACFFRDDGLSDAIGFTYSSWHAEDAVSNLVHHLENIAAATHESQDVVVSIIMDGENAWEYYPDNGYYFLSQMYHVIAHHPGIELTTFSECLQNKVKPRPVKSIVAGSWVYGTFSTWIGDKDKNRAWDMLVEAKHAFDRALSAGLDEDKRRLVERQLAICEGSDWCWWFGDYNPSQTVSDFDRLYRQHLGNLYHLLEIDLPEYLEHAFSHGGGEPATGGVMRRGKES